MIDHIKKPILKELEIFKEKLSDFLKTDNPLLSSIYNSIFDENSKQMRVILSLLSAKICGTINEKTYRGAIAIELIHNASLLHDDVIDNSEIRRGKPSMNSLWNNKIAILSGDNLVSKSMSCIIECDNKYILNHY